MLIRINYEAPYSASWKSLNQQIKYMKQTVASKNSNKETSKVITLPLVFKKLNENKRILRLENKNNSAKMNVCT